MDDSPASLRSTLLGLKWSVYRNYNWSLADIDGCDICNLLAFVNYKPNYDPNVRVIDGRAYYRASKVPEWL